MIPKNKYDEEAVEALALASDEEVMCQADQLLEWLQDRNWPVFDGIVKRLSTLGGELVEPIGTVFRSNDSIWKANIVGYLIPAFSMKSQILYLDLLEKLNKECTDDDIREGLTDFVEIQLSKIKSGT